jgi:hypothetical protein
MYGEDIAENFVCMITFCDGSEPKVVSALSFKGGKVHNKDTKKDESWPKSIFYDLIPKIKAPWYLEFNNSALYKS